MTDRIFYINSNLSSVPCEGCYSAPVPPAAPAAPGYYHVLYRGHAQAPVAWHGETYCLIGGYRVYGDAPLAAPAKAEEEKPAPRRAPKRHRVQEESDQDLGCPRAKVPRLKMKHGGKRLGPQTHAAGARHLEDGLLAASGGPALLGDDLR